MKGKGQISGRRKRTLQGRVSKRSAPSNDDPRLPMFLQDDSEDMYACNKIWWDTVLSKPSGYFDGMLALLAQYVYACSLAQHCITVSELELFEKQSRLAASLSVKLGISASSGSTAGKKQKERQYEQVMGQEEAELLATGTAGSVSAGGWQPESRSVN